MAWIVLVHPEVQMWVRSLSGKRRDHVVAALEELRESGPSLGRPFVDSVRGSNHSNMKELRPRGGHLRLLFAFDPSRRAVVVVGGDKRHQWKRWYDRAIPIADERFGDHLNGLTWNDLEVEA